MSGSGTYAQFEGQWGERAQLAWDAINMKPTKGIPTWMINDMQWSHLEEISGNPPGSYEKEPVRVYDEFQTAIGCCFIDQWISENPLSMKDQGYGKEAHHGATTGAEQIVCDGIVIDSPEAVVEHMEKFVFPSLEREKEELAANADAEVAKRIAGDDLFIIGGVSVTTTIPHGTPQDVRDQMKWLVEKGPKRGLMLGGSSSISPGAPIENIKALCEGFAYYREHGKG
jgi:hypothetical protein